MDTNNLSHLAKIISDLANSNLEQLQGKCQDEKDMQDYYLGILQKQALLLLDLSTILKNRQSKYISTPYIVLRSLLDDFMHLMYLELSNNKEEEIIKINAEAYKHCFVSLQNLTDSNYEHFDGKYPFYLKQEEVEKVKNQFVNKDKNKKYFKEITRFKFKSFMTFNTLVGRINHSREIKIYGDRAYYLWKEFSEFVHYSTFSFKMEQQDTPENMNKIDESFQYCYNSIYLSFKYFASEYDLNFIDNEALRKRYGIILP